MYASACDCWEGDAYGQTNRPNPVIREKSNAFPPACDLCLHLHVLGNLLKLTPRETQSEEMSEMSYPVWDTPGQAHRNDV